MAYSYMQKQEMVLLEEEKVLLNTSVAVAKASFMECMNQYELTKKKRESAELGEESADIALAQNEDRGLSANAVKQQSKAISRKLHKKIKSLKKLSVQVTNACDKRESDERS